MAIGRPSRAGRRIYSRPVSRRLHAADEGSAAVCCGRHGCGRAAGGPGAVARGRPTIPRIPTLKAVLGHDVGEEISTPEEITIYLKALAAAAPDRTRLVEYARTWEGRPLHVLVIGSPERIARLDAVKADLQRLADPRAPVAGRRRRGSSAQLPVVVWLMHGVHGNEISSSDAALAEAYHLLAAQGDAGVDAILRERWC